MTQDIAEFMNERLTDSSVVAWGAYYSSTRSYIECRKDWFTSEQVEQTLHHLVASANNLTFHRIDPVRLCWVYDRVRIVLALRPDGECLGIVCENRPGQANDEIEQVLKEYLARPQT
jgi:hypothetical protein